MPESPLLWSLVGSEMCIRDSIDRFQIMFYNKDVLDDRNKRAFLLTPREEFVLPQNLGRAYDHAFLDIGYGVTISGPHLVGRMTTAIDVQFGEAVLEALLARG